IRCEIREPRLKCFGNVHLEASELPDSTAEWWLTFDWNLNDQHDANEPLIRPRAARQVGARVQAFTTAVTAGTAVVYTEPECSCRNRDATCLEKQTWQVLIR